MLRECRKKRHRQALGGPATLIRDQGILSYRGCLSCSDLAVGICKNIGFLVYVILEYISCCRLM